MTEGTAAEPQLEVEVGGGARLAVDQIDSERLLAQSSSGARLILSGRCEIAERRSTVLNTACICGDVRRRHRLHQAPADIGRARSLSYAATEGAIG